MLPHEMMLNPRLANDIPWGHRNTNSTNNPVNRRINFFNNNGIIRREINVKIYGKKIGRYSMAAWNIVENDTIVKSQSIYMGEGYTQLRAEYVALLDSLIFV